ncbi:HNH endonuclease family protein [Actinomyces faecalis]|uniref:HNH endonuclease family protein n=1 Tax=Actinomyces faecalis TaxID=2722820 RepID=UPI001FD3C479|nr:HNH endonuclease family protein [Actinomyces faecalis]
MQYPVTLSQQVVRTRLAAVVALVLTTCLAVTLWAGTAQAEEPTDAGTGSVPWDERGRLVLSAQDAATALTLLPPDEPATVSWGQGGSRTGWFGRAWEDVDGDGCDTRNEILARDLTSPDFSRDPGRQDLTEARGKGASVCPDATVWSGVLDDPYTGRRISFQRGQDTSSAVQIDHVVPLSYLYAHGAWTWDSRTRLLVANDPLNLLAVDGEANGAKGACGPATCPVGSSETGTWDTAAGSGWWPPEAGARCTYAQRFVSVLAAYRLGVPEADHQALADVLASCAAGGDGQVSWAHRPSSLVPHALATATDGSGATWLLVIGLGLVGASLLVRQHRRR